MSRRWNYKVVELKPTWRGSVTVEAAEAEMSQWGQQGWELVSTVLVGISLRLFFKKEL